MTASFSIVTPTNRQPGSLLRMLDALSRQDYPAERFEAIVVVDGRPAVAASLRELSFPFRFRVLEQPAAGPAAARNRGVAEASEAYVLFLDDDVVPSPSLIARHAEAHTQPDVVAIGPLVAAALGSAPPWTRWEWTTLQAQYRAMEAGEWPPTPRQFYTGNASVRRDDVLGAGGFDPAFRRGEDVELAWRLHARGLRFVFDPLARAEHFAERSFDAWLAAAYEYGRTDVMLERIRTGHDLPGWVQSEFGRRHRYSQTLARVVLRRPEAWRVARPSGWLGMWSADRVGLAGAAGHMCSALFTAAYWRGVAAMLGRDRAVMLTAAAAAAPASGSAA